MSQPVLLRASLTVALIRVAQVVLPPLLIAFILYIVVVTKGVAFDRMYLAMAGLATILSAMLLRPRPSDLPVSRIDAGALAVDMLLRWLATLALLYFVGRLAGLAGHFPRSIVLSWAVVAPLWAFAASLALQFLLRRVITSRVNERSSVIIGMNLAGRQVADRLMLHPELCTRVEGFFDDRGPERLDANGGHQLLGRLSDLVTYVKNHRIDVIFIALPIRHVERVMALLDDLHDSTASIYYVPDVFVFDLIQSRTADIMGVPVVSMRETPLYGYRGVMKRVTDLAFTILILALALLPMLAIAILVKITSRGPAIFKQRRYGLGGEEIVVYKFRTMRVTEDGAEITQARRGDSRITPLGRFLRRFSLDELPQLFNVLQGRMSLVGPRPHAIAHNEQYRRLIKGYMIRHKVLPGITGLAQVNGLRGETTELSKMQERVNYDLEYLRRWSPSLDLQIIVKTALQTVFDHNAY